MSKMQRVMAVDVMRGITLAGMILVNNAGSWSRAYEPLRHAPWHGLTPTDLVFPFFMFIMGVSTYLSMSKRGFKATPGTLGRIARRAAVIFLVGLMLTWISNLMYGYLADGKSLAEAADSFGRLRILGVLQRLALSYGLGALVAVTVRRRWLPWVAGGLLVAYAVIMWLGNGYEYGADDNVVAAVDRAVVGADHMYRDRAYGEPWVFDPEGLLSTLPSVAHVLIGFLCGALLVETADRCRQMNRLFLVGTVMTVAGLLLSYGIPLNKKVWSPTFVLTTCGLASSLLAVLIWVIDVRGWRGGWTAPFRVFGLNPLYLYVQSGVLAYTFGAVQVHTALAPEGVCNLKGWFYYAVLDPVCCGDAQLASLVWALLFVGLNWLPGYWLYRRGISIRI